MLQVFDYQKVQRPLPPPPVSDTKPELCPYNKVRTVDLQGWTRVGARE